MTAILFPITKFDQAHTMNILISGVPSEIQRQYSFLDSMHLCAITAHCYLFLSNCLLTSTIPAAIALLILRSLLGTGVRRTKGTVYKVMFHFSPYFPPRHLLSNDGILGNAWCRLSKCKKLFIVPAKLASPSSSFCYCHCREDLYVDHNEVC